MPKSRPPESDWLSAATVQPSRGRGCRPTISPLTIGRPRTASGELSMPSEAWHRRDPRAGGGGGSGRWEAGSRMVVSKRPGWIGCARTSRASIVSPLVPAGVARQHSGQDRSALAHLATAPRGLTRDERRDRHAHHPLGPIETRLKGIKRGERKPKIGRPRRDCEPDEDGYVLGAHNVRAVARTASSRG